MNEGLLAWRIINHSINQIFSNLNTAFKLTAVLWLFYSIYTVYVFLFGIPLYDFFWNILLVVIGLWIAIAWHRFILKDEHSTILIPRFYGKNMLSYFWVVVLIFLILCIPIIGIIIIFVYLGLDFAIFFNQDLENPLEIWIYPGFLGLYATISIFYYAFLLRWGACFPAIAIGSKLGLKLSWQATKGHNWSFLGLSVFLSIITGLIYVIVPFVFQGSVLSLIWSILSGWIIMMLNISVLTTIYGYFIEKRPLT